MSGVVGGDNEDYAICCDRGGQVKTRPKSPGSIDVVIRALASQKFTIDWHKTVK